MRILAVVAYLVSLVTTLPVGGQVPDEWPQIIGEDVRARIGEKWDLDAADVHLAWGPYRGPIPAADSPVDLVGAGHGGHWIVRVASLDGGVSSVRVRGGYTVARLVAGRRIERGEALAAKDIAMRDTLIWGRPATERAESMEGWLAHRAIEEGEVLASPAVQPPLAVEGSRPVDLLWDRGMIGLRMPGTAVRSGHVGDEILVRTESGQRLWGVVVAPGTVRLTHAGTRATSGGLP